MIQTRSDRPYWSSIFSRKIRQRRLVAGVARHHLVGQRKTLRGDDQRDHHLHAVRALVPAVAELALARKRRVAFEITGCQIVKQDVEAGVEQRFPAFPQKREQRALVRQQLVQAAIQHIVGDDPHRTAQQVPHRAVLVPVPVQAPLAARIDQLVAHLRLQDVQPARALPAHRQPRTPEPIQLQAIPKRQRQPASPPLARAVQTEILDVDANRLAIQLRCFPIVGKQRHRYCA